MRHASEAQIDRALEPGAIVHLHLSHQLDCYTIALPDGRAFAVVNCKAALAFDKLRSTPGVSLRVYTARTDLASALRSATKATRKADFVLVHVNVDGPSCRSESLGDLLSANEIFLQEPVWNDPDVPYSNPHVLDFPDISEEDSWANDLAINAANQKRLATHEWNNALNELPQYQSTSSYEDHGLLTVPLHA